VDRWLLAMIGGLLLSWKWPLPKLYLTIALPMLIAALAILGTSLTGRAKIAYGEWRAAAQQLRNKGMQLQ